MQLIRTFEERAAELFQQGVIVGTAHSCVGQEAIAVGAAGVMRETDYLVGHHRSHGHLIAAGSRPAPDDGRDVRPAHRHVQGARRLDAHRRPVARHPRLQRHRRRRDPARLRRSADGAAPRQRPGVRRVLRRRSGRAGRGARGDEPRGDLAAPGGVRLREQPVRALGRLAHPARGRGPRRPRRRVRDARRDRRRQRPRGGRGRGRPRPRGRARRRRPLLPRDEDVPAHAALDARQPPRRARPGGRRRVGAARPPAPPRARRCASSASSTTSASTAIRAEVAAEVEAAIETALADEEASVDDLLPSVLAPHRPTRRPRTRPSAGSGSSRRSARHSTSSSPPTPT